MPGKSSDQNPDAGGPDPDPDVTPGLQDGGQTAPGDTPPAETGATSGLAHAEQRPIRWMHVVVLAVTAVLVLAVAGFFIGLLLGLL